MPSHYDWQQGRHEGDVWWGAPQPTLVVGWGMASSQWGAVGEEHTASDEKNNTYAHARAGMEGIGQSFRRPKKERLMPDAENNRHCVLVSETSVLSAQVTWMHNACLASSHVAPKAQPNVPPMREPTS